MKAEKLSTEIAALERQSSKAKNAVLKKVLAKKIDKLKTELESITSEETAKESIKKAKTKVNAMDAKQFEAYIKNLAKDPKFSFLKNMTSGEIVRDMKRTAKPVGWRFRGRENFKTPTKRDVKDNNNVYYENRRNRSDVSRSLRLETGGGISSIKVGAKLGLLNPRNGRYKYSIIEKIEGENVYLVEKHPTRSQWDNHWETTKSSIKRFLNEDNEDFKSKKSYVLKYADGGGIDGWENLSNVKPNSIEISETSAFGNPDKLILKYDGKQIAKFYYNMRGYNSDFSLKNSEGLYYGFGGDKPKSKQVSEFKKALKEGFTFIKGSKYKNGGGIDEEGINLFEDYENIPENVQNILDKYEEDFEDGNYEGLSKATTDLEKIGYTFEYGLDGGAYDLRPIGTKGKSEAEEFKNGGGVGESKNLRNRVSTLDKNIYVLNEKGLALIDQIQKMYSNGSLSENDMNESSNDSKIGVAKTLKRFEDSYYDITESNVTFLIGGNWKACLPYLKLKDKKMATGGGVEKATEYERRHLNDFPEKSVIVYDDKNGLYKEKAAKISIDYSKNYGGSFSVGIVVDNKIKVATLQVLPNGEIILIKGEKKNVYADGGGVDLNDWDMPVIRTQFEDEEFEYAKGGETGEPHRTKVNGMMAKGGAIQHGLKVGDKIVADQFWENTIVVENAKTNKRAIVYLETGKRKEA
jgi:hypothetical protein